MPLLQQITLFASRGKYEQLETATNDYGVRIKAKVCQKLSEDDSATTDTGEKTYRGPEQEMARLE